MKPPQLSRSGPASGALLRQRYAFAVAVGGALLVASFTLPSSFDETFETLAERGHGGKAPEEVRGASSIHVALAGVVPQYDEKADSSRWWGSEGEASENGSGENSRKTDRASRGPSLMSIFRQQIAQASFSASGDFGEEFSSSGNRDMRSASPGPLNMLAMNPLGDVQTMASALPPSASFHASAMPLRENMVPIDDGSSNSNVPGPHTWNSYGSAPISVSDGTVAVNPTPTATSALTATTLSAPTFSPAPAVYTPAVIRSNTLSTPLAASSPVVQPIVSTASAPTTVNAPLLLVRASTAVLTPTVVTNSISTTPTTPTGVLTTASTTPSANIGYQFVTVGNPGNANDPATGNQYGGVNYSYDIGKYDVTIAQYVTFLNAVAAADTYGLYDTNMASDGHIAGITRTGANGAYTYAVSGDGNRPITYVTWFDAARFANWVNNGQPTGLGEVAGSTETGAYTLRGALAGVVTRNANATVWIPTESEWYKAAYYDPTLNGGAGGYWSTAAQSNSQPGNTIGSLPNQANYNNGTYSTGGAGGNYLTDVGAFNMSMSPYGTYDQMGDVNQWNDAIVGQTRGFRGGAWDSFNYTNLLSTDASYADPGLTDGPDLGFRLAGVPEPATCPTLLAGVGLLIARRRRRSVA